MDGNRIREEIEKINETSFDDKFEFETNSSISEMAEDNSNSAFAFESIPISSSPGNVQSQFANAQKLFQQAQQLSQQRFAEARVKLADAQENANEKILEAQGKIKEATVKMHDAQIEAGVKMHDAEASTKLAEARGKLVEAQERLGSSLSEAQSKVEEAKVKVDQAQANTAARVAAAQARVAQTQQRIMHAYSPFPNPPQEFGILTFGERPSFSRFGSGFTFSDSAVSDMDSAMLPNAPPIPPLPAFPDYPHPKKAARAERAKKSGKSNRRGGVFGDMLVTNPNEVVSSSSEDIMKYNAPKLGLKEARELDASFRQLENTYKMLESTGTVPISALENFKSALQDKKRVIDSLIEESEEPSIEESETSSLTKNNSADPDFVQDEDTDDGLDMEDDTEVGFLQPDKPKKDSEHEIISSLKRLKGARVRQYYVKDTLYQLPGHIKVKWFELFLDLLYVGAVSKAGKVIEHYQFSVSAIWRFTLILTPLIFHWNYLAMLNNSIHHNGIFRKIFTCVFMLVLIYMGISVSNAFEPSGNANTGGIFVAFHVATIILMESYISRAAKRSIPNIGIAAYTNLFWVLLQSAIYSVMYFFPSNGTEDRQTLRQLIWTAGLLFELVTFLGTDIYRSFYKKTRIGIHAEHLRERVGCFVLFVMGNFSINARGNRAANSQILKNLQQVLLNTNGLNETLQVTTHDQPSFTRNLFVETEHAPPESLLRFVFCFAFVGIYFTLGFMGITHKEIVKPQRLPLIDRNTRIKGRFVFGLLWIPLAFFNIEELNLMITGLVVTFTSVLFEELGRYGYHYKKGSGTITFGARTEETTQNGNKLNPQDFKMHGPQKGRVTIRRKTDLH
ncbi:hypothetical protein HDV01_005959 [Terramyces sp. JEL0728]|nr:hypothetical protein HDV01_005959 [Terramyces sp. JEL0728]